MAAHPRTCGWWLLANLDSPTEDGLLFANSDSPTEDAWLVANVEPMEDDWLVANLDAPRRTTG